MFKQISKLHTKRNFSTSKPIFFATKSTTSKSDNMSGNNNPGNFANRPKEEVREIASKGGHASHSGGFASMDPDKQREIASKGGKASSGSFEPGSEKAREAGRKGGHASGGDSS